MNLFLCPLLEGKGNEDGVEGTGEVSNRKKKHLNIKIKFLEIVILMEII